MVGVIYVYVDTVYGFYGYSFLCLVGCFSMIIPTPTVLSVLYACVLYICICTYSAQLSMFHTERHFRNTLITIIFIIIIIIITITVLCEDVSCCTLRRCHSLYFTEMSFTVHCEDIICCTL